MAPVQPEADLLFFPNQNSVTNITDKHTELHKDDFISDNEFYNCLEQIPSVIEKPDYLSIHPKDSSISFKPSGR